MRRPTARKHPTAATVFSPLSPGQRALWLRQRLTPQSAAHTRSYTLRLRGPLDVEALRRALAALLTRHALLRATFPLHDDAPVQRVQTHLALPFAHHDASNWSTAALDDHLAAAASRPLDPEHGPLLRAALFTLPGDAHVLLLTLHDLVADAGAAVVLLPDLAALYQAEKAGLPAPPFEVSADDGRGHDGRAEADEEALWTYWRQTLRDAPPVLALPIALPRPPLWTEEGAVVTRTLAAALSAQLEMLAHDVGVTLDVVLLAAFCTVLFRYTGQEDLVLGVSLLGADGRAGARGEALPLRLDLAGEPSFAVLLRHVGERVQDARAHAGFPVALLVERLAPPRAPGYAPLVQIYVEHYAARPLLVMGDLTPLALGLGGAPLRFADLEAHPLPLERRAAREDLTLRTARIGGEVVLSFEYRTALYDADAVVRLAGHVETLLTGAADDAAQSLSTLPLLTPDERAHLLTTWNGVPTSLADEGCLHQRFEDVLARTPARVVIEYGAEHVTCREFTTRANRLAHYLQRLGVGPEVVVGLYLAHPVELAVALVAVLKAGGAYLALDPTFPAERLSFMLADAGAALLLTQQPLTEQVQAFYAGRVVRVDAEAQEIAREPAVAPQTAVRPDNASSIRYTSGSTGAPKGVVRVQALTWIDDQTVTSPPRRVAGVAVVSSLTPVLTTRSTLVVSPNDLGRDPSRLLRFLCEECIELAILPGLVIQQVAEIALHDGLFPTSLREVRALGEQLRVTAEIMAFFAHLPGCTLRNLYGSTESGDVTTYILDGAPHDWPALPPIGRALPRAQVYLLDAHRQLVPIGVEGELYVGGATLARGYLNRPTLTAERFVPHPFSDAPGARLYRTGDRARRREDGLLQMIGRADRQVKVRAFRVELGEVEATLRAHPEVADAAVLAREEPPGDTRLVAYVVPREGRTPGHSALHAFVAAKLPSYMVPVAYVALDALPRTPNNKVDRRALPPPPPTRPALDTPLSPPRTPLEETLCALWAELLGLEQVGIDDDFFALGGHSLLAMKMMVRLRTALGVEVPLHRVFEEPTVAHLAVAAASAPALDHIPVAALSAPTAVDILAHLDALSEAEIDDLLDQLSPEEPHA